MTGVAGRERGVFLWVIVRFNTLCVHCLGALGVRKGETLGLGLEEERYDLLPSVFFSFFLFFLFPFLNAFFDFYSIKTVGHISCLFIKGGGRAYL